MLKKQLFFRLSLVVVLGFYFIWPNIFSWAQEEPAAIKTDKPEFVEPGMNPNENIPTIDQFVVPSDLAPAVKDMAPQKKESEAGKKIESEAPTLPSGLLPDKTPAAAPVAPEMQPTLTDWNKENLLKSYSDFMKMMSPKRDGIKLEAQTTEAQDNPIWKFHSWLQDQLAIMEQTGGETAGGKGGLEELCFVCHNGKLVVNPNFSGDYTSIKDVFQLTSRHPVRAADKSNFYDPLNPDDPTKSDPTWERKLQCTTCHNPAVVTGKTKDGGYPLTLPTDPEVTWTQKLIDGWPTLDNPPWPHDTPPRPIVYGRPYADDPNPDVPGDEKLGPDATELPNFTSYCQTCHRQISGRYGVSNNYSRLKYDPIRYIKGDGGGNVSTHGLARGRESNTPHLKLREPFYSLRCDAEGNVVNNLYLACVDCHEPHGSSNAFLLRTKVNGVAGVKAGYDGKFFTLCSKCHIVANPWPGGYPHGSPGDMAERSCIQCHNHSSGGGRF
ncbi:MAG: hypothetical protein HZA78_09680 [Candidatus Schekmanbacteria bacterium]|nr:hypothetical protein [Candidatus Schekmanbacteria bacterium]